MNKEDKLQKVNVPKLIKTLSVVYIVICAVAGFAVFLNSVLEQGRLTLELLQYAVSAFEKVIAGFIFWGVGQVFTKFMEKKDEV